MTGPTTCQGHCANHTGFSVKMAFQPVIDIDRRRIYGYEALVRGSAGESAHNVLAGIARDELYAFDQHCRVTAISAAARLGLDRRLSINFMPNAVYHPEACLRLTIQASEASGFPIENITFEFTENEEIIDRPHLANIVTTYRQRGFMTALDDFGAGFAGLSLLADFQPDLIKIDRVLVDGIDQNKPRQAIVAGIVATAKQLSIGIIAEGVERFEEVETLRSMGVNLFQGFYFARPAIDALTDESRIANL